MSQDALPQPGDRERLLDLLVDRATEGLGDDGARELDRLLSADTRGASDAEAFDLAAAALTLGLGGGSGEPMPASLRERIESQAMSRLAAPRSQSPRLRVAWDGAPPVRPAGRIWLGWLAAAACLGLAVAGWWPRLWGGASDPRAQMAELEHSATDVVKLSWNATPDPAAKGAAGQVIWSDSRQEGYMRFTGLAANDPSKSQYQLWIFTEPGLEPHPVDGGVFDIPAGESGEVVVKIDPKIRLNAKAAVFAVTVERPGGVVVSDRSRIALVAKSG